MILRAGTDPAWVDAAVHDWQTLLIDHANCEKKAASTALALVFSYPEDRALTARLSRLAREELRHFEQVERMAQRLDVAPRRLGPGRYAGELRRCVSTSEPRRKLELMLCGALIEARSCERFELLEKRLPAPLGDFYGGLAEAERRHAGLYLELATELSDEATIERELSRIALREAELATGPDTEFRFHSGTPA
ncbi:MAG: tRNA isopentenyl-2-thiomethyl-A-37 hydroxylase MiaE [Steroidobacteraceae bacterium]